MSVFAAIAASDSEINSSGVTILDVVLPKIKFPGRLKGVIAARQCPDVRWYVTTVN
jgi:hypothetical protein